MAGQDTTTLISLIHAVEPIKGHLESGVMSEPNA